MTFRTVDCHGCRNQSVFTTLGTALRQLTDLLRGIAELHSPSSLSWQSQILLNFMGSVDTLRCTSQHFKALEGSLDVALGLN